MLYFSLEKDPNEGLKRWPFEKIKTVIFCPQPATIPFQLLGQYTKKSQ